MINYRRKENPIKVFNIVIFIVLFSQTGISQVIGEDTLNTAPWSNSVYLSAGYGTPQGFRSELGYNFGSSISLAFTFGIGDTWSNDPSEGSFGLIGKFHLLPVYSSVSYLLFGFGGSVQIWGESDSYTLIFFGSKIPWLNWLRVCPEIGLVLTTRHISGGSSLFGSASRAVFDEKVKFGLNVSFEIDFRQF